MGYLYLIELRKISWILFKIKSVFFLNKSESILKVAGLGKQYRLGQIGFGTISHDLNRWWAKLRGKEDPFLKVGVENDRTLENNNEYVWAIRDISFEVNRGEVLGIIGKNGAGKSTLLKVLSKVTGPTKGEIVYNGRIAALLEVGTGFHPELTGKENVFLNGAILGMTRREVQEKFDEIIEFAGVKRYIDTPVKRYSSGMLVRLGFAVAAHLEPEILIVDEVLAVGDFEFQKKCLGKMDEVSKSGRTVLFVSHNMAAVKNLCDRAIVIDKGSVVFSGNTDLAIDKYLDVAHKSQIEATHDLVFSVGENQINKIRIFSNQQEKQILEIGDNLKVQFDYLLNNTLELKNFNVAFRIYDEEENCLCNEAISDRNMFVPLHKSAGKIEFILNDIRLYPGKYFIKIFIASPDWLHEIISTDLFMAFEILESSKKVNRLLSKNHGQFYLYPEWNYV